MLTSLLFSLEAQDFAQKVRKSFLEGKYYDPEAQDIAGKVRKSMGKDEKPVEEVVEPVEEVKVEPETKVEDPVVEPKETVKEVYKNKPYTLNNTKINGLGGGLGLGFGKETASRFSFLFFRRTNVFDYFVHFSRNISSISPNIYKDYSASAADDWYHSQEGSKYPIFIIGFGPLINYKNMELLPSIGFSYNTSLHRYFDPSKTLGYKGYYYIYGDDGKYFPVLGIGFLSRKSKDLSFYGNCHIGKIISISIGLAYEMDVNYY